MQRMWIMLGALAGLGAVGMAAMAAHRLRALDSPALASVNSAIEMQGWHALALLGCGQWAPRGGRLADAAGAAFAIGVVLFCGAIYANALFGVHLELLAPVGGVLLMLGWAFLAISAIAAAGR